MKHLPILAAALLFLSAASAHAQAPPNMYSMSVSYPAAQLASNACIARSQRVLQDVGYTAAPPKGSRIWGLAHGTTRAMLQCVTWNNYVLVELVIASPRGGDDVNQQATLIMDRFQKGLPPAKIF